MPLLWQTAADIQAADSCSLRYDSQRLISLVPCIPPRSIAQVVRLIEEWHTKLNAVADDLIVSGGRSATHAGASGLSLASREALCAVDVGDRVRGAGSLTPYGDIFVLDYASRLVDDPRLGGLYDRVPSRLRTFDESEHGELLPTLEAFLDEGSINAAAERMNVHRNSLTYRLKRIQEITRVNLDDPETRFLVQLALHAHRRLASDASQRQSA
ncbi:MAG: hypothetical protein NVSMB2_21500 [Chloroflexota bacterium]